MIGIVDRNKKRVYAKVSLPNKENKRLSGNQLSAILNEVCKSNATVITDEFNIRRNRDAQAIRERVQILFGQSREAC